MMSMFRPQELPRPGTAAEKPTREATTNGTTSWRAGSAHGTAMRHSDAAEALGSAAERHGKRSPTGRGRRRGSRCARAAVGGGHLPGG